MATWRAHGAVFVEGGKRRKGVVYLSDTAPKSGRSVKRLKAKAKAGTGAGKTRRRRKHGRK